MPKHIWLPMAVDTDLFKPYGEDSRDVVMLGTVNRSYPVRQLVCNKLMNKSYFEQIPRPLRRTNSWENWPVGKDYARVISSAKICPTSGAVSYTHLTLPTTPYV